MNSPKLRIIKNEDIQLLRYWKNLDHIRYKMIENNLIGIKDQRKWFANIDENYTKYFIYSLNDKDVGNVKISNIDYKKKLFEAGIFCGDKSFLNHWINIWACIEIYDYAFNELKLKKAHAIIKNENTGVLRLNKSLGYIYKKNLNNDLQYLTLDKNNYLEASVKIKKYLNNLIKLKNNN